MRRTSKTRNILVWIVVVAVVAGLLGFDTISGIVGGGTNPNPEKTTREIAMSCTLDMYTQFHIHPHLNIIVNGSNITLPQNIGITLSCMHPIHTHDSAGIIHVESPVKRDFTLGDFFGVWGEPFSKDQILNNKVDGTHEIVLTVNGSPSDAFENLVLEDKQQIVIEYKAK